MIMKLLFIFIFCSFFFSALPQFADTLILDDVEIYGSISEIRQKQSGRSLTIFTSDQITKSNISTIDEIIRFIPGIETQSRNLFGVQADYSIRGSTFNQVLVLIDGVRLNDPLTGHFSSYIPIALSEIKRIEVIRGPAAVFYGPDAVGGVINIITKNSAWQIDTTLSVNIRTDIGQFELVNTDAGFFKSDGKFNYSGGIRFISSGGYPDSDGLRNDFRLRSGTASFSFMPTKNIKINLRTALDGREFSARRFYSISQNDTARENIKIWWNHLHGLIYGTNSITSADLAIKLATDNYKFNSVTPENIHTTTQITSQLRNKRELSQQFDLVTGAQVFYRSIESNDRGNHNEFTGGVYALTFLNLENKLNLSGGIRLDFGNFSTPDILPQFNISYNIKKITLRALAGKTVRIPDFTERYVSTNLNSLSPGRNLGNPGLLPEKSWSLEGGTEINITRNILFESTIYSRFGYHLIDYTLTRGSEIFNAYPLVPDGLYFFANNIAKLKTSGLEFILKAELNTGVNGSLNTYLGYNIQRSVSSTGEVSKYISNLSPHLLVFQSRFTYKNAGLQIYGMYKQRNRHFSEMINSISPLSYWLFNLKTEYRLIPDKLSFEFRADNTFNKKYSDINGAELPGRWLSIGIKYWI